MSLLAPRSFTIEYPYVVDRLHTQCGISKAFNPAISKGSHPKIESFTGLWDTGATNSVITKIVVDKLGLVPTGMERVFHAGGESIVNTYLVNILLPNQVVVYSRCVTEGIINGADVLIGMDIIARGDFTVSSKGGKTKFCFQLPSTHDFDFAQEEKDKFHTPFMRDKLPERNDPCHCGSGKKYKNCHGK